MNDGLYALVGLVGLYFIVDKMDDNEEKPNDKVKPPVEQKLIQDAPVQQPDPNRPFFRGPQTAQPNTQNILGGKKKSKRKPRKSSRKKRKSSRKPRKSYRKKRKSSRKKRKSSRKKRKSSRKKRRSSRKKN
tara:strand:- start:1849 stop:2241 length:393 start_codon:yes stop_codon:yes gene_type:complete